MTLIRADSNKIINLLSAFVENKIENSIDDIVNNFTKDDFEFFIKTYKYESSINIHTAKRIVNFQNSINKIVEYFLKRRLFKSEKEKIIIEFSISRGCTEEKIEDFFDKIKEILEMLPEKHRLPALIAIFILICYIYFIGYKKEELYYNEEKIKQETINNAIDKMSKTNLALINIIKQSDRNNLNELQDNEKITINDQDFTNNDIEKIKLKRYPKQKMEKKVKSINGNFKVTQINIKRHYIIIEDDNDKPNKILYDDNLFGQMRSFKEKFKKAIDDEGKLFYIEASFIEKNGKKGDLILNKIEEIKDND